MLYQTHARIHLDNIRHNIQGIRQAIGAERKLLVSVKANAYGHGAVPVARLAEDSGVDWLSVATVPEGMELRQAGIHLPILKFSPLFAEEMEAARTGRADLNGMRAQQRRAVGENLPSDQTQGERAPESGYRHGAHRRRC